MKLRTLLLFIVLFALGLFLSLNMNSKYRIFTYKSAMWADASGYYVYLPATFIYHWDPAGMPHNIDTITGQGFILRNNKSQIFTKYTSGQSYLHLPFFLAAHAYCKMADIPADGFTQPYVTSILVAGVFYMLAGLFLIYFVLRKYYSHPVCLATVIALLLCTNLYYYSIKHPGLSHTYSFFLVGLMLYLTQHFTPKKLIALIALSALLVSIRPTNITLPLMILVFGLVIHGKNILNEVPLKYYVLGIVLGLLICFPQMLYWHFISGHWIMYSYENEGFIFWNRPHIMSVLFAPKNGYFTYSPIMLLALVGLFFKPLGKKFSMAVLILFVLMTYIYASWHSPTFGCACGGRSYIDLYPIFAFGLAALFNYILMQGMVKKVAFSILFLVMVIYNILFIYRYDDCWRSTNWDWGRIVYILKDELPQ